MVRGRGKKLKDERGYKPSFVFYICIFSVFFAILLPTIAHAAQFRPSMKELSKFCPKGGGNGGGSNNESGSGGIKFISRFVPCLEEKIVNGVYDFASTLYPLFAETVDVAATLAVTFFGAKLLLGTVQAPPRDGFMLIIKIGIVLFFVHNPDIMFRWFLGMDNGSYNVLDASNSSGGGGGTASNGDAGILKGMLTTIDEFTGSDIGNCATKYPELKGVWGRMDCVLDKVIGIKMPETLYHGMMGFFFNSLFSGAVGIAIAIVGFYITFNLIMAVLRAVQAYLIAFMVLSVLLAIGVFFIPLLLFGATYGFFRKWVRMGISMILQPMILFAYLNILLFAFDYTFFTAEFSIYRTIAGDASQKKDFNMNKYLKDKNLINKKVASFGKVNLSQVMFPTGKESKDSGLLKNTIVNKVIKTAKDSVNLGTDYQYIDYKKAGKIRSPNPADSEEQMQKEVFAALILTALMSYVFVTMLTVVEKLSHDLGGGAMEAPSISGAAKEIPLQGYATKAVNNVGGFIEKSLSIATKR